MIAREPRNDTGSRHDCKIVMRTRMMIRRLHGLPRADSQIRATFKTHFRALGHCFRLLRLETFVSEKAIRLPLFKLKVSRLTARS